MSELFHLTAEPRSDSPRPYPCIILLHGRGSNEEDLLGLTPQLPPELFVVSVRAPFQMGWPGSYCWYQVQSPGVPEETGFRQSLAMLPELMGQLPERYGIDPGRIIIGGFSQGAMMSACLTLTRPNLVIGAAVLSGFLPALELEVDSEGCKGKPVFMAHGSFDGVLSLNMGLNARARLEERGLDVEYHQYEMDHQVVPQELADLRSWLERRLAAD